MTNLTDELIKIEKELEQLTVKNEKAIADLQAEVDKAQAERTKAQEKVIKAKQGSSATAFSKAVAEEQTAGSIVDYYTGKVEELQAKPLVTDDEYKEFTERIKAEVDKLNDEAGKEVAEALEVLAKVQPVLTEHLNKGNELLKHLQHDLYKDDASQTNTSGKRVRLSILENRHKEYDLSEKIEYILNVAK